MKTRIDNRMIIVRFTVQHRAIDIVDGPDSVDAACVRLADDYGPDLVGITWTEYFAAQRACWLTPPVASTKAEYWEMLEVLPPDNWEHADGVERFTMCERMDGTFTASYAQQDDNYLHKIVDLSDRSTFITSADFVSVFGERAA